VESGGDNGAIGGNGAKGSPIAGVGVGISGGGVDGGPIRGFMKGSMAIALDDTAGARAIGARGMEGVFLKSVFAWKVWIAPIAGPSIGAPAGLPTPMVGAVRAGPESV
jgi:hypothetical protein